MRTNEQFRKSLKAPTSSFYLCDFHVHSPGSADTHVGQRFADLSDAEKSLLPELGAMPPDLAAYEKQVVKSCPPETFYDLLLKRRDELVQAQGISQGRDWAVIAITDHNVADYAAELSQHAWENLKKDRLIILPGIELDVKFTVDGCEIDGCAIHLLCIFAPQTSASDIRLAITDASGKSSWSFGSPLVVGSLPDFVTNLRHHDHYPSICIAAHVGSSKGIQSEVKKSLLDNLDAAIARTSGEMTGGDNSDAAALEKRLADLEERRSDDELIHDQVLRQIGICGLDALQVRSKQDEKHYRRLHRFKPENGRAVPITCSDAHTVQRIFTNEDALSFLKLSGMSSSMTPKNLFNEIREKGLRYADTRFSYASPGYVSKWITGVEIVPDASDAESFWPFVPNEANSGERSFAVALSRNLNCLIGGRGSGKSAALEAIAFATQPEEFNSHEVQEQEWYKRAYATLRGCVVRLCWNSTGDGDFSTLDKKTLFQRRYFDPNHKHVETEMTDIEGKEVLSHSVSPPKVALFRIHQIEEAAQPDRLLDLFDRISGDEVATLNNEIETIRSQLGIQRDEMIELANSIAELTKEKAPLREFIRRKQQFLEVDKPEVKEKYEQVDNASAAEVIANKMVNEWQQATNSLEISGANTMVEEWFIEYAKCLKTSEGKFKPNCENLFTLVDEDAVPNRRQGIVDALKATQTEFNQFAQDLKSKALEIASLHKGFRDQLSKDGLPTGGKDREAKKKAFDEAVNALETYRSLCAEWNQMLEARTRLRETLEEKCVIRTNLRKETAENLTTQLARDLDSSVLRIEADARPVADKDELLEWLSANFAPSVGMKFRAARAQAIVENGVTPAHLKDIVLSINDELRCLLLNDKAKAEDGKISLEDIEKWVGDTIACYRAKPESDESSLPPDFWNDLPEEIRLGLLQFNLSETDNDLSRLHAALQLDEIVFDDLPEIRLNDRPNDSESKARPLSELSPGQRCSAILPILLLTGTTPLLIDQPEDNLDNRLIRQVIVNILASIKLRRQVIVATHNPNLPVLGDAEQAIILRAVRERGCELEAAGNLDSSEVVKYITDIMEGGREAFQYRQSIYQSHWDGPVAD